MAARAAAAPKQPSGILDPDVNPHRRVIAEHIQFKGPVWAKSQAGREWIIEHEAEAEDWDARRAVEIAEQERQAAVKPLRVHAEQQTQAVFDGPNYSQEEVEQAQAALAAACAGDRAAYVSWEQSHHAKELDKLAADAAAADSVAREAAARRDAILKSGLDYTPAPVPEVQVAADIPIDRSKAVIVRKINTPHGVREVTEIVDAE
jgi:hypothetical protein